jgi:HD-GYP domain-containing protein (c-di-GMP phosphodiesterase class II)
MLATQLGSKLGIKSEPALNLLGRAGWLHDIGKIIIPTTILSKPWALDAWERKIVDKHAAIGAELVRIEKRYGAIISPIILYHHEWFDGSGHYGLIEGEIPRFARIISIVDSYDAMYSDRPYREPRELEFIQNEFIVCSGTQFDPVIVDVFFKMMGWPEIKSAGKSFPKK